MKRAPGRVGQKKDDDSDDIVDSGVERRSRYTPRSQGLSGGMAGVMRRERMDEMAPVPPEDKGMRKGGGVKATVKAPGLYANINAKRARIKKGSGEMMRLPGAKGSPTNAAFKRSAKTAKRK